MQCKTIFNCVGKNVFMEKISAYDIFALLMSNVAFGTFMPRKYPGCSGLVGCGTVGSDATTVPLVAWSPGPSPRSAKDFYFDLTQGCLSEIYLYFPD